MAVILVVAALTIPQIDKYMLGYDASFSIVNAGWAADTTFSPLDTLAALFANSPDQGPLYFLLLNLWGYLVGHEIALARVLTIFFALLSLAMMYRLAADTVSPMAGAFAVIIMASNAFYTFYFAHVRYYPLIVLLSTIVIWLYLRIVDMEQAPNRLDYLALICACAALVSTHAYGVLLYAVCALYHLIIVRKNRRWLAVVAAAGAALALAGPILFIMLTQGLEYAELWHRANADDLGEIFVAWFNVNANGSLPLFLLSAVGIAIGWRRKSTAVQRSALLFVFVLLGIALISSLTGIVSVGLMRHLFAGMPIAVLFQAAGLYALYCERRLLGALLGLWAIAGLSFFASADWNLYLQGRILSYQFPPRHLISRVAHQSDETAQVIGYQLPFKLMGINWSAEYLRESWFTRQEIEYLTASSLEQIDKVLRWEAAPGLSTWLAYQSSRTGTAELAMVEAELELFGYRACGRESLPIKTEMVKYSWISFDCQPAQLAASNRIDSLEYQFYGAELDPNGSRLFFADNWTALGDGPLDRLQISHQLISEDWDNVAQLDLPLVNEGERRQFSIDVSEVPPGTYRLIAIVYDRQTGVALDWQMDSSSPPSMLLLREVSIR